MSFHHFKNQIKVWFQWIYLSYKHKKYEKNNSRN